MTIFELKLAACLLILAFGLVGGLLPLRFGSSVRSGRLLNRGNGFSAGIFLGAGLIHMLGDAQNDFSKIAPDYPYALLIAGAGFLAVLCLEMVILRGREDVGAMAAEGGGVYPFLLTVVLSVHSLIAGTAVGLETSSAATFALLIAILAHKGSAAFALGVSLKSAEFPRPRFISIVALFSCMTPLGVLTGTLFSRSLEGAMALRVEATFDSLAAGTFVYVAVLDIIDETFEDKVDLWVKFVLLTLGFGGMALLAVWT
jgi:zinc transporter 1/2/3